MPGIAALVDSDMEDNIDYLDENSIISSATEDPERISTGPAKKSKKRHRVTMPKPRAKITKSSPVPTTKKPTKKSVNAKKSAIEAQMEESELVDTQTIEADDILQEVQPKAKARGRPSDKTVSRKVTGTAPIANGDEEDQAEVSYTPVIARSSHAQNRNVKTAPKVSKAVKASVKRKVQPEPLPETQQSESMEIDSEGEQSEVAPTKATRNTRLSSRARQEPVLRRRAASASDTERGDPNLRRRLGDITRKFENIDAKYRNLKEVGVNEANASVEKLRRQCEATTEASNNLVLSLKKELALQAPLVTESRRLKKEVQTYSSEVERLKASNSDLESSLTMAQNEISALQAKLSAARTQSTEPANLRGPNSTAKNQISSRSTAVGNSEALQIAQMKLDLYGDLTGLLVHSVKRKPDGDSYECIQTGKNGTLHFKLFIDAEDAKNTSFEETELLYQPLLNANRDRDLIDLMPQYLAEDITFARRNAAKFYQRVVDTLSRQIE